MLICEELFLLLTKGSGSLVTWPSSVAQGLGAAVVADLLAHERLTLETTAPPGKKCGSPRVCVIDPTPTGHPVLDQALENLVSKEDSIPHHKAPDGDNDTITDSSEDRGAEDTLRSQDSEDAGDTTSPQGRRRGRSVFSLIFEERLNLRPAVAQSLASAGTVKISKGGFLGRQTVYRVPDPAPREAPRQRLHSVLSGHAEPTQADRVLLAVLRLLGAERRVLPQQGTDLSRRGLRRRVTEVIGEDPLGSYLARAKWDLDASDRLEDFPWWGVWLPIIAMWVYTMTNIVNHS